MLQKSWPQWLLVLAILCAVPFLVANAEYRFTFDNPTDGRSTAPFVLEYFSLVECVECRRFESEDLVALEPLIATGQIRVVYRDMPSLIDAKLSTRLFCLQEYDHYSELRREAKLDPNFDWTSLAHLTGRSKARFEQCLETDAAGDVQRHNRADFMSRGLMGTPAFTLVYTDARQATRTSWSGRTTRAAFIEAMDTLRDDVGHSMNH